MAKMISILEAKRTDGPIDFQRLCVEFTLDTIGVIALESSLGGLDGSRNIIGEIVKAGYLYVKWMKSPFVMAYCNRFPNSRIALKRVAKLEKLKKEWTRLTNEILDLPDPPEGETPIWHALRTVIDPETKERLPYEQLRSEIATVVFAGMDTTGHEMSWILGMLATNPRITEELLIELKANNLCGSEKREVEFEDLSRLPYLNAVIKEGFRLAYVLRAAGMVRSLPNDMMVDGYRLPKGTSIFYPGNRAMNTEADWGDPDVVRPERWLTEEDMSSKYFLMFGYGPRDCPGQSLALLEIRLALVTLVSRYHFSTEKSFSDLLESTVDGSMIECKGGMMLHVSPRLECETLEPK